MQPESLDPPAHDALTRLLHRLEPDPDTLRDEARPMIHRTGGLLVLDDSTSDRHYAKEIDLDGRHGSGKHERVVWGINLIILVWTDGDRAVPYDYRLQDKAKHGLTKDDHFLAMLKQDMSRDFGPRCVAYDSGYSGLEDLKAVRACGRTFLSRRKANRSVDLDLQGYRAIDEVANIATGTLVHPEICGSIRVFEVVSRDGERLSSHKS